MLSILIPTHNYDTLPLVRELHAQATAAGIPFEILVLDDASLDTAILAKNQDINHLDHAIYEVNPENAGRSKNRNLLAQKAQFDWILFLDCDTIPTAKDFISKYLDAMQSEEKVCFGGLAYRDEKPNKEEMLRWIYGKERESISLSIRQTDPYRYTLISNILLRREILMDHPFNEDIEGYGFEDMVFILELKKRQIKISQIDNPVFHLNLESSILFIEKYHSSLSNLKYLLKREIIDPDDTPLSKLHSNIRRLHLENLAALSFRLMRAYFLRHLTSEKPSLFVFDLYKLGYFCNLKNR